MCFFKFGSQIGNWFALYVSYIMRTTPNFFIESTFNIEDIIIIKFIYRTNF